MDLTFPCPDGVFNVRVAAVFLHDDKILAMQDERSPYFYLPGGRVKLGETFEHAILRECSEELDIEAKIIRPLWLVQSFFTEDVSGNRYHELCCYYLIDPDDALTAHGDTFPHREREHRQTYSWLAIDKLSEYYLYPLFLKDRITDLPQSLVLLYENEDE